MRFLVFQNKSAWLIKLIVTLAPALVGGCAGIESQTYPEVTSLDAATVQGSWKREALTTWQGYFAMQIDGGFVQYGFMADKTAEKKRVEAGPRLLLVNAFFNRGNGQGPQDVYLPIRANLQPSVAYVIQGKVSDANVEVWLEEQDLQKRVSEVISSSQSHPHKEPMFIPIVVPKR